MDFVSFLLTVLWFAALWMIFKKMGYEGWEGIIPFYNLFILFKEFYGNGWRILLLLIPIYDIILLIMLNIKIAHAFGQSTGFGWGLALLPFIFYPIMGFGSYEYMGGIRANRSDDFVSRSIHNAGETFRETVSGVGRDPVEKLRELERLRQEGIITEEEFNRKKEELLKRI